ncbi:hypothetical protein B5U98_23240 [Bosea sp. Tri-39]|nr:hypothetical protein BLM15_08075 [Bosea sp. Tri-49]RXT18185.1 hypothetical protein B5U98_23240 [Bosea sp. Tri-39]RXT32781.1 hypothetical protein B5U99_29585 [Bosea sp. Tri-54]
MTSSEKRSRDDGSKTRISPSLPAVRHSAFTKHWLAVDDGGAELTKAVFGAPARRTPPRPTLSTAPMPHMPAPHSDGALPSTRLRATVALLLLALAVLFAQPAARLLGLAARPEASGTVETSRPGKTNPIKPNARPQAKRAGDA